MGIVDESNTLEECFTDPCGSYEKNKQKTNNAGRVNLRQKCQPAPQNSADALCIPTRRALAAEGKDAALNSPLIVGQYNELGNATVGKGRRLKPEFSQEKLGWNDQQFTDTVNAVKDLWREDMYSKRKWIDQEGDQTLPAMQKMILTQCGACGEAYTLAYWFDNPIRPFRTALGIIDDDRVRTPDDLSEERRKTVVAGHNQGPSGRTNSYFIHDYHRNDPRNCEPERNRYTEVRRYNEFGREQVIHTRIKKSPGLTRGLSDLASCFSKLKCFEQYKKARLEKVLMELSIAVVIKSSDKNALGQILGNGPVDDTMLKKLYALNMQKAYASQKLANDTNLNVDGTKAIRILENEEIDVLSANTSAMNDKQFVDDCLNDIARASGMTKATITQDFDASFSAARATLISFYRHVENLGCYVVDDWTQSVYTVWLEDVIQSGRLAIPNYPDPMEAWMHFVVNREWYCRASFSGPARMEIDADKAAKAAQTEQNVGTFTYQEFFDTHKGADYKDAFKQQFEELKEFNRLLVLCGYDEMSKKEALAFVRPGFSLLANAGTDVQPELDDIETEDDLESIDIDE